jgi:hypothetical protein
VAGGALSATTGQAASGLPIWQNPYGQSFAPAGQIAAPSFAEHLASLPGRVGGGIWDFAKGVYDPAGGPLGQAMQTTRGFGQTPGIADVFQFKLQQLLNDQIRQSLGPAGGLMPSQGGGGGAQIRLPPNPAQQASPNRRENEDLQRMLAEARRLRR